MQYNETFYDFLRRTANRCGEFLYFEDGKLNLGLTKTDKTSTDYLQDAVSYNFDSLYANSVFSDNKEVEYYNYNYLKTILLWKRQRLQCAQHTRTLNTGPASS